MKRWHADRSGHTPILHGAANVSWLSLDPNEFVHLFHTLYEGMLAVYYQKVATAWERAVATRVQVSVVLPSREPAEAWLFLVRSSRHLWPLQMAAIGTLPQVAAKQFMSKERRRLRIRHIWEKLEPDWPAMKGRIFNRGPTNMSRQQIYNVLFGSPHQGSARWQEATYQGPGAPKWWQGGNKLKPISWHTGMTGDPHPCPLWVSSVASRKRATPSRSSWKSYKNSRCSWGAPGRAFTGRNIFRT